MVHIVIRSESEVSPLKLRDSRISRISHRSGSTIPIGRRRGNIAPFSTTRCCSLRRGVAAGSRRRGGDAAPAAGSGDADADPERAPGRAPDPVATDIGADDRRLPAERLRAARLAPVGRRSPRPHLHAVRGLRQLRRPGRLAVAHRVRHC